MPSFLDTSEIQSDTTLFEEKSQFYIAIPADKVHSPIRSIETNTGYIYIELSTLS